MTSRLLRLVSSSALALLLIVTAGLARAAPDPLPPNSNAFGKGYAELSTAWVKWTTAAPGSANPTSDPSGALAAVGQSGKVWFLSGTFGGPLVTRTIEVPAGKALFFPIINFFWVNTPEFGDNPWSAAQEAWVRSFLAEVVDTAVGLYLEIDGKLVTNLSPLRVAGPAGNCTLPLTDNIFGLLLVDGPHECLADGYWALLPPLSDGYHTIRFGGGFSGNGFAFEVTYQIAVRGR